LDTSDVAVANHIMTGLILVFTSEEEYLEITLENSEFYSYLISPHKMVDAP